MAKQKGFEQDWVKAKEQLLQFSHEAMQFAKKGEEEVRRLSHISRIHFDLTALELKRERLVYMIGKEYIRLKEPSEPSAALRNLVNDYKTLLKEQKVLKAKIDKKK